MSTLWLEGWLHVNTMEISKYSGVYAFVENTTLTNIAIVSRVPTPADAFSGKVTVAS